MKRVLNSKLLREFLVRAGKELSGEWVLVGGTLLPAVGIDVRSTVDIDLVYLGKNGPGKNRQEQTGVETDGNTQTLRLMSLADSLGLPAESVNQAATFFLKKVGYQNEDLILFHPGSSATLYRPSLELFWKLKIARLSETDLQDCQHYFTFCEKVEDPIDLGRLSKLIEEMSKKEKSAEKRNRLKVLAAFKRI